MVASFSDSGDYSRITLSSDGSSFAVDRQPVNADEYEVWDDFDGDGTLDVLTYSYDGTVNVRSEEESIAGKAFDIDVWSDVPYVNVYAGDYDGDGAPDLAFVAQSSRDVVTVSVAHNNGSGFDDATEWATLPQAGYGSTSFFPGDWDTDGDADLLALVPTELKPKDYDSYYWSGPQGFTLLSSDGSALTAGTITPNDIDIHQLDYAVGDFSGEGEPMVASEDYLGNVIVYRFDGARLREAPGFQIHFQSRAVEGLIEAIAASDVDGDGLDDVVFATWEYDSRTYEGFQVARSTGTGLSKVEAWGETPDCPGGDSSYCLMRFQQGS